MVISSGIWLECFISKEKLKTLRENLRSWHLNHTLNIDSKIQVVEKQLVALGKATGW